MRTLIDDLLGYATLDARPSLRRLALPALVEDVVDDLADEIGVPVRGATRPSRHTMGDP
jgi:hypothetical protein